MLLLAVVCGSLFIVGPLTAASNYDRDRAIEEGLYELPPRGANWCGNTILMDDGDVGGGNGEGVRKVNFENHEASHFTCDEVIDVCVNTF